MQSKREYLVGLGLAKPGRGKFSNAAKEALAKAEASGTKFADSVPAIRPTEKPTRNSAGGQSEPENAPKVYDPSNTPYLMPDEYRFPEKEYRAISYNNGKKVEWSLREACNTCRVSLVNHMCDAPTILGDVTVKIERR